MQLNITPDCDLTSVPACRAWCYASLVPTKDMELVVQGSGLSCPCFQYLLHAALRALIDRLGVATFNVGIFNIRCGADEKSSAPYLAASVQAVHGSSATQPPTFAR